MRNGRRRRRSHTRPLILAAVIAVLGVEGPLLAAADRHEIRVDRASFADGENGDFFSYVRIAVAVGELLHRFPDDFPQPPPIDIKIRAQNAAELTQLDESLSSAGCELIDGRAEVIVNLRVLTGTRALNDAELRSLLGHEMRHAYQFAKGSPDGNSPDFWRREVEAFEWELSHDDAAVRPWYRRETQQQLRLYYALLDHD
jgi:hypothetical protein